MSEIQENPQEEVFSEDLDSEVTIQDILYLLGGAAVSGVVTLPLDLLGMGWAGVGAAVVGGIGAAVYREELGRLIKRMKHTSPRSTGFDIRMLNMPLDQMQAELKRRRALINEHLSNGDLPEDVNDEAIEVFLNLGETLQVPANRFLSARKAIFGVSDAGKSNNISVICEELARLGVPMLVLDTEDEYQELCKKPFFRNPLWVDRETVTPANAFLFAQRIMDEGLQVVINLQSYEEVDAALVMFSLIRGLQTWEESFSSEDRAPCEVVLDEASVWLPQNVSESTLNKAMVDDPEGEPDDKGKIKQVSVLSLLHRVFFGVVVRRGRKRGIGFTLATQRIAEIDKRALQANWFILMRQTLSTDFEVYKKHYGVEGEEALNLLAGEAYVIAPGQPRERHQLRKRKSPSGASTPGYDNLQRYHQRLAQNKAAASTVTANYQLTGIVKAPAYEQTAQYYYPPRPVYSATTQNNSVYSPVNGSTSAYDGQQTGLLNENINTPPEHERVSSEQINVNDKPDTSKVSAEKRETIQRLATMTNLTHREIAKAVKLDGPKYAIYRQVCIEEGIEINK